MTKEKKKLLNQIAQILFDKKAFNILAIDVRECSTFTDYLIIAEGHVDRHVQSLARAVMEDLKKEGESPYHVEGMTEGEWVLIDYIYVMVHLFIPPLREKYQLERLWEKGKIVDLTIDYSQSELFETGKTNVF